MARETISPGEYERWLPPRDALNELKPMPFDAASEAIIEHAREGNVQAAARTFRLAGHGPRQYQKIDSHFWQRLSRDEIWASEFWNNGIIKEFDRSDLQRRMLGIGRGIEEPICVALGVRFDPDKIRALGAPKKSVDEIIARTATNLAKGPPLFPEPGRQAFVTPGYAPAAHETTFTDPDAVVAGLDPETREAFEKTPTNHSFRDRLRAARSYVAQAKRDANSALATTATPSVRDEAPKLLDIDSIPDRGGRPSPEFWLDMSLEIAHRIHMGDFKPKNQAQVVDAMERWLIDHRFTGGLTKIKECAARVFKLFKD